MKLNIWNYIFCHWVRKIHNHLLFLFIFCNFSSECPPSVTPEGFKGLFGSSKLLRFVMHFLSSLMHFLCVLVFLFICVFVLLFFCVTMFVCVTYLLLLLQAPPISLLPGYTLIISILLMCSTMQSPWGSIHQPSKVVQASYTTARPVVTISGFLLQEPFIHFRNHDDMRWCTVHINQFHVHSDE